MAEIAESASVLRRRRRRKVSARMETYVYPVGAVLLFLLLWQLAVVVLDIKEYILPQPLTVLRELVEQSGLLLKHAVTTSWEIVLGYAASVIVGIPLGLAIFYSRVLERSIYPFLVASQSTPKIAVAPLLVIWFGWGLAPKVIVAFMIAIFPIIIDTVVGLKATTPEMVHLARSMGANRRQIFIKISLPNALPNIFAGLKVGITLATVGAVVGEFIASDRGLGYLLVVAHGYFDTPLTFAGLLALSAVGVVFFMAVELLERVLLPWHAGEQTRELTRATM